MARNKKNRITDKWIAQMFHYVYEGLAPEFGYETNPKTRRFNPRTKNGRLMVATVKVLRDKFFDIDEQQQRDCEYFNPQEEHKEVNDK